MLDKDSPTLFDLMLVMASGFLGFIFKEMPTPRKGGSKGHLKR